MSEIRIPTVWIKRGVYIGVGILSVCAAIMGGILVLWGTAAGIHYLGVAITDQFTNKMPDGVYQAERSDPDAHDLYRFVGEGIYIDWFPRKLSSVQHYVQMQIDKGYKNYVWDTRNCFIKADDAPARRVELTVVPNMSMNQFDAAFSDRNLPYYRDGTNDPGHFTIADFRKVFRLLMKYAPPELQERVRAKYDETGLLRPGHSLQEQ